ncbi:MAG: OmpA family protein, partial [Mucinivorans sp.]
IEKYATLKEDVDVLCAEGALIIQFKQGSVVIDPSFGQNQKTIDKIREIIKTIESDSQTTLEKIVLAGASSPEGTAQQNDVLAQKRADALKQYLGVNVNTKANLFEVVNVGEDWTGLRQMVEASDMQYKSEVLEIMDKYSVKQGREKQLMDLKWGRPYNYMMEHFFPKLRSAGYIRVFYDSKPSPEAEATNQAIELYNRGAYADVLT